MDTCIVSPAWLAERLSDPNIKVIDGTWYHPVGHAGKDALTEHLASRIPGAKLFELDGVADLTHSVPHMLPGDAVFSATMDALGITADSTVVVYDRFSSLYSSPRVWWTFKVFGHKSVLVLEGVLPAWQGLGLEMDNSSISQEEVLIQSRQQSAAAMLAGRTDGPHQVPAAAHWPRALNTVRTKEALLSNIGSAAELVVDARSLGRFKGVDAEPWPGLACGHIPGSKNVPFQAVQSGPGLKPATELRQVFADAGVDLEKDGSRVVASCGSGLTACILALAVHSCTGQIIPVYDGSFAEWGQPALGLPVEKS
ncbi:MAG: hypothetical protein WDW38_002022 [Sanguina aurantia]